MIVIIIREPFVNYHLTMEEGYRGSITALYRWTVSHRQDVAVAKCCICLWLFCAQKQLNLIYMFLYGINTLQRQLSVREFALFMDSKNPSWFWLWASKLYAVGFLNWKGAEQTCTTNILTTYDGWPLLSSSCMFA